MNKPEFAINQVCEQRQRRHFSREEKSRIVSDAGKFGVSAAARKWNVNPNQVFVWRKETGEDEAQGDKQDEYSNDQNLRQELQAQIAEIDSWKKTGTALMDRIMPDLESEKLSLYCATTGYSSLVSTLTKLHSDRGALTAQLRAIPADKVVVSDPVAKRRMQQQVETFLHHALLGDGMLAKAMNEEKRKRKA